MWHNAVSAQRTRLLSRTSLSQYTVANVFSPRITVETTSTNPSIHINTFPLNVKNYRYCSVILPPLHLNCSCKNANTSEICIETVSMEGIDLKWQHILQSIPGNGPPPWWHDFSSGKVEKASNPPILTLRNLIFPLEGSLCMKSTVSSGFCTRTFPLHFDNLLNIRNSNLKLYFFITNLAHSFSPYFHFFLDTALSGSALGQPMGYARERKRTALSHKDIMCS